MVASISTLGRGHVPLRICNQQPSRSTNYSHTYKHFRLIRVFSGGDGGGGVRRISGDYNFLGADWTEFRVTWPVSWRGSTPITLRFGAIAAMAGWQCQSFPPSFHVLELHFFWQLHPKYFHGFLFTICLVQGIWKEKKENEFLSISSRRLRLSGRLGHIEEVISFRGWLLRFLCVVPFSPWYL